MSNLYRSRRREIHAINSHNLSWSESRVSDVDVLAARGMSRSRLGADLYRLKYGFDRSAYEPCFKELRSKFARRRQNLPSPYFHAALHEFLDDRCTACGGRMAIPINANEVVACSACNGSGERRYTAEERAAACSVKRSVWPRYERDYLDVLECIHRAVNAHQSGMSRVLASTS
ncbi:hypothetical protein WJH60_18835 [Burkholderia orbicola]|uniref:hypothetical protein n=1 Tax=Burkholderia cepacia complex TaxID=87882 RepID=UPI00158C10CB|nr:hypothetical protein [Burkholderia cenocepacia]